MAVIHFDNSGIYLNNIYIYMSDEQIMDLMEIYMLNRRVNNFTINTEKLTMARKWKPQYY